MDVIHIYLYIDAGLGGSIDSRSLCIASTALTMVDCFCWIIRDGSWIDCVGNCEAAYGCWRG